eukprot:SAG11_NODE_35638_length_260_cov_1.837349_1_plen_43_part_10
MDGIPRAEPTVYSVCRYALADEIDRQASLLPKTGIAGQPGRTC